MKIKAIKSIIEFDQGQMVVLNPGDTGDLSDKKAREKIDAGEAVPAGAKAEAKKPAARSTPRRASSKKGSRKAAPSTKAQPAPPPADTTAPAAPADAPVE